MRWSRSKKCTESTPSSKVTNRCEVSMKTGMKMNFQFLNLDIFSKKFLKISQYPKIIKIDTAFFVVVVVDLF